MLGISLFHANNLNSLKPLDSNSYFNAQSKLVIKNNIEDNSVITIQLYNPFNYIINNFFLSDKSPSTLTFYFNDFLPSGKYFLRIIKERQNKEIENKNQDYNSVIEYVPLQFSGAFSKFDWAITYAISCFVKQGLDIRLAAPKQYFPFFLVESLEGRPSNTITTDVWSNWLLYDTSTKIGTNSIMFGFRSIVHGNYMIFGPEALAKEVMDVDSFNIKFLKSEQGIEVSDNILIDFSRQITAKSIFGIIHQILFLISNHVTFRDQQGEFGAKYALLNRQGDCTEYSALFTALCRIKKIPSRLVAGLKRINYESQSNWIRHAWSEIYYEGLWIPIDVVEAKGKLIGFHPDLIPLFKGNWMEENNMNREIKISILEDFENKLSFNDLLESYSSLSISYKVLEQTKSNIIKNSPLEKSNTLIKDIKTDNKQLSQSKTKIVIEFSEISKNSSIGIYYKAETGEAVKSPKIVQLLDLLLENKKEKLEYLVVSPENPGFYELGVFVTNAFGELLGLYAIDVEIIV